MKEVFMGDLDIVRICYAIHKSLHYSAIDIQKSIEMGEGELEGTISSQYSDGWIILEPRNLTIQKWQRKKEDYIVEYLYFDSSGNIVK